MIAAASDCFAEQGFHCTSMATIASRSGLSIGSLYHFFENKEAIIEAIVKSQVERLKVMLEALRDIDDVQQRLATVVGSMIAGIDRNTACLRMEILAEAGRTPRIASIARSADEKIRKNMQAILLDAAPPIPADDFHEKVSIKVDLLMAVVDSAVARRAWDAEAPSESNIRCLANAALA